MGWETPELLVLQSGAEATNTNPASGKHQSVIEGVGASCDGDVSGDQGGIGCPGGEIIVGPS